MAFHVFALAGYDVLMTDISRDAWTIGGGSDRPQSQRQVGPRQDPGRGKSRRRWLDPHLDHDELADLGKTDLIIEAATERETVKRIFEDLLPHLKPTTILTSNTSSISITRLASRTDRSGKSSWVSTS